MPALDSVLDSNRAAVSDFLAAAEQVAPVWEVPRAPGKWSPCQITEHVARTLEEGAHLVAGDTSVFPTLPPVIRPLVRSIFFKRVLKKDAFPNAKTVKALNPPDGPSPAEARGRLEDALESFQDACRAQAARGQPIDHPVFGRVSVEDYAKFMKLHTEHHRQQLPTPETRN